MGSAKLVIASAFPIVFVIVWLSDVLVPNSQVEEINDTRTEQQEQVIPKEISVKNNEIYTENDTSVTLLRSIGEIIAARPPPCKGEAAPTDYSVYPNPLKISAGRMVKFTISNARPEFHQGGELLRVQIIHGRVSAAFDVKDLGNGTYLATLFVSPEVPEGKYLVAVQRIFPCQESLLDYWCVFNYSAPPHQKCPLHGRHPLLRESGMVLQTVMLEVDHTGPIVPRTPCADGTSLHGTWVRKEHVVLNEPPCLTKPVYCIHDTLTLRANYFPVCKPPEYNLAACTRDQFLIFLGDSTLRNIYYATARMVRKVNTTGSLPAAGYLMQVAPKWNTEEGWTKKANYYTYKDRNPVYFAWASHVEMPAPPLTEYFTSVAKWQEHFKFANKTPHIIWGMGAHSPGMNKSVLVEEVSRHARFLADWMRATGGRVTNVDMKAVRSFGRGLHPVYANPRIDLKNKLAAAILAKHGIPSVDLFHPTIGYWTNWEYHGDNIHYKDWVDHVLRDLLLPFVCAPKA